MVFGKNEANLKMMFNEEKQARSRFSNRIRNKLSVDADFYKEDKDGN